MFTESELAEFRRRDPWFGVPHDPADPFRSMPESARPEYAPGLDEELYGRMAACPSRWADHSCGCGWPFRCRERADATVLHRDCLACLRARPVDPAAPPP